MADLIPALPLPTVLMSIFFFQAEDGIRDLTVTGVQTCALPILARHVPTEARLVDARGARQPGELHERHPRRFHAEHAALVLGPVREEDALDAQIGRASCRERV